MWCCCAYFVVLYILVRINISWCLFTYRLGQWVPTFLDAFLPLRIFEFFIHPL